MNITQFVPQPKSEGEKENLVILYKEPIYSYVKEALQYLSKDEVLHYLYYPWIKDGCLFVSNGRALAVLACNEFAEMKNGRYYTATSKKNIIFVLNEDVTEPLIDGWRIIPKEANQLSTVDYRNGREMMSMLLFSATREDAINPKYIVPVSRMHSDVYNIFQAGPSKPVIITGKSSDVTFAVAIMPIMPIAKDVV